VHTPWTTSAAYLKLDYDLSRSSVGIGLWLTQDRCRGSTHCWCCDLDRRAPVMHSHQHHAHQASRQFLSDEHPFVRRLNAQRQVSSEEFFRQTRTCR
jgi:hypothetical protein